MITTEDWQPQKIRPYGSTRKSKCEFPLCTKKGHSRGLCSSHYRQWYKGEKLRELRKPKGSYINKLGYRLVWAPGHPTAPKSGWVMEHRKLMSDYLGRPLLPHENVHHRNGNKLDNKLVNLELWSTSQPSGQRVEDKVAYAKQILNLYGDYKAPKRLLKKAA